MKRIAMIVCLILCSAAGPSYEYLPDTPMVITTAPAAVAGASDAFEHEVLVDALAGPSPCVECQRADDLEAGDTQVLADRPCDVCHRDRSTDVGRYLEPKNHAPKVWPGRRVASQSAVIARLRPTPHDKGFAAGAGNGSSSPTYISWDTPRA